MAVDLSPPARAAVAAVWPQVLGAIAGGELVRNVLAEYGLTRGLVRGYLASNEGARAEWEDARLASADAFMDLALDEAMSSYDKDEAAHVRTRIDTYKWAARIRNPHAYSDRAQLDVNVKTIDLTRIISEANQRLAAREVGRVIDASAQQVTADALSGAVLGNGIKGLLSDLT